MPIQGIINAHKPQGWTSFQVVALVRRLSHTKKVGHAGTLDPAASGVLPICLGAATRLVEYLMDTSKVYRAYILLGITTDTYDASGNITHQGDASNIAEAAVRKALGRFVGDVIQRPPPYSAVKHQGRRLYHYARAGSAVEGKERQVHIYRLQLLEFQPPQLVIEVECSRGTYVRSLAHDLGQALGCGGHLQGLVRTRVGPFTLAEAHTPEEITNAFTRGCWPEILYSPDEVLLHWQAAILGPESEGRARRGQPLTLAAAPRVNPAPPPDGQRCRAYSADGRLVAILRFAAPTGLWHPEKVFPPSS